MNSQMFLESLRKALYGKVSERDLTEHMRYYENYLSQELAGGRSEQEVLEELGDPRLIARTLIETSGAKNSYKEFTVSEDGNADEQPEFRVRHLEGWKAKAAMAAVLAVFLLLLVLIFHIMVALLPAILVIGVIVWLIRRIQN